MGVWVPRFSGLGKWSGGVCGTCSRLTHRTPAHSCIWQFLYSSLSPRRVCLDAVTPKLVFGWLTYYALELRRPDPECLRHTFRDSVNLAGSSRQAAIPKGFSEREALPTYSEAALQDPVSARGIALEEIRCLICAGWKSLGSSRDHRKVLEWSRAESLSTLLAIDEVARQCCVTVTLHIGPTEVLLLFFFFQLLSLSRRQAQVDMPNMSGTLSIQTPLYSSEKERIGHSMRKFFIRRKAMTACQPKDSLPPVSTGKQLYVLSIS